MPQNRLYFAVTAPGLKADGNTSAYTVAHGVQSASSNIAFNLENIFELGQNEVYEIVENNPDVDLTLEKVIDGYPLLYHLATRGSAGDTIAQRSNQRCIAALSLFSDVQDSASGTPIATVEMSGMYVNSVSYNMPVEGNCTENVSLIGNNCRWSTGGSTIYGTAFTGTLFDNTDQPLALTISSSGGVQRRENVLFGTGASLLPLDIPGINSNGYNVSTNGQYGAAIQNISVSCDFGREELLELGRKNAFHRYVNFPVEVTTDIEVLSKSGHWVNANEGSDNVSNRSIRVFLQEGTDLNMGTRNKLVSVSHTGGDAGGGNVSHTYSYRGFSLSVDHPNDPG